jgi:hypothetical protein
VQTMHWMQGESICRHICREILQTLRSDEAMFRALDREGRQLHRTASIQVYALEETGGQQAQLIYGFSYEPAKKDTLYLVQKNQRWFIASPKMQQ